MHSSAHAWGQDRAAATITLPGACQAAYTRCAAHTPALAHGACCGPLLLLPHRVEGDNLSRKAGDLESSSRKLKSQVKDLEGERDKLQVRRRWGAGREQRAWRACMLGCDGSGHIQLDQLDLCQLCRPAPTTVPAVRPLSRQGVAGPLPGQCPHCQPIANPLSESLPDPIARPPIAIVSHYHCLQCQKMPTMRPPGNGWQ